MNKEKIIEAIKDMPDDVNIDDLIERILFVKSIEDAIKDMDEGNEISHEEIKKMVYQWRTDLYGPRKQD